MRLICLLRNGARCVCELEVDIKLKHNLLCHHLKKLEDLGVLKSRNKNKYTYYELNSKLYQKMLTGINRLLGGKV